MSTPFHVYGRAGRLFGGGLRAGSHHTVPDRADHLPRPVREALGTYAQNGDGAGADDPVGCVAEVMARGVTTVHEASSAADALRLLHTPRATGVAVVNDAQRLVGMVLRPGQEPPNFKVRARVRDAAPWWQGPRASDVMLTPVPAVSEATALREVRQVLADLGLSSLPVTNAAGGVVGHIARHDVDRARTRATPLLDCWA